MSKNYLSWLRWPWKKKFKTGEYLRSQKTVYANNFKEIIGCHLKLRCGVQKVGGEMEFKDPKIVYGWLDPTTGMDENKGWFIFCLEDLLFEFRVNIKQDPEAPNGVKITVDAMNNEEPDTFEQFQAKLRCNDYGEMLNEDTDKTVNEELSKIFKVN